MTVSPVLAQAVSWWSSYYGNHEAVSVTIRYVHIAATVVGGGNALAVDRFVFGAVRETPANRAGVLRILRASHRVVVPSLILVALTGALMTAADTQTFLASRLFWIKMGLFVLLMVNGIGLLAAEAAVSRPGTTQSWGRVAAFSGVSLLLWLVILLAGTWLTVAA